jgi:hypothetical protein
MSGYIPHSMQHARDAGKRYGVDAPAT